MQDTYEAAMPGDRGAAVALTIGSVAMLITMGLHPSGPETLARATHGHGTSLARGTHTLALAAIPILGYGFTRLSWWLRSAGSLSGLALASQLMALVAVLGAGTMSGLVATTVVERLVDADMTLAPTLRLLLWYTGVLNQAFAAVYVVASGVAMVGWSLALWRRQNVASPTLALPPRSIAALGVVIGVGLVAFRLGVVTHLDVRIFGLVIVAQAIWQGAMAWLLWQRPQSLR